MDRGATGPIADAANPGTVRPVTAPDILWFTLALLLMLVGLVGSVLPALPGTPLIFAVAVGHRFVAGPSGAQWWVLFALGVVALLSLAGDYLASVYGAKTLGATRRGMIGAGVGGLVGLFVGPVGILLGPFVGAFGFEYFGGREWRDSAKAGIGATLGLFVGALGKLACGVGMILLFAANVLWRVWHP